MSSTNFFFDEPGSVSTVTPGMGAEGTGVLVRGSGLLPSNVQLSNITVGGIPAARVVTATNLEVSIIVGPSPTSNSNNAEIVISASDGSFVDGIFFSFINLSISLPGLSQGQEGTMIDVTLPNRPQFDPTATLRATIDDLQASILSVNTDQRRIVVRVPRARNLGTFTADVAVEGANGLIARLRDGFTYLTEGIICVVEPSMGQMGTRVTLEGENLLGGGSMITSASVVGQPAIVVQSTNSMVMLRLMSPSQPSAISFPERGDIVLTADTGAVVTRLNAFELITPGNIAQLSRQAGQNGTMVAISGTNLIQGNLMVTSVTLAGTAAVIVGTPTDTIIRVEAASSAPTQPLPVIITLSTGATIVSGDSLSFTYLPAGQVRTVQPNIGPVGTRVVITGINLLQGGTMASVVTMAGISATINSASDMSITLTIQAGVEGNGDVVIVSDTGATLTGVGLWTYEDLGTITSVSPTTGQHNFEVTILGEALLATSVTRFASCNLAGVPGVVTVFNRTAVQCRAGVNPSNRMNLTGVVELTTITGVVITSASNLTFTYYPAYIDTISPSQGNNGTEVTIRGMNLFSSPSGTFELSRVLFGTVETTIVSSSANEIRVRVGFLDNSTIGDTVRIESTSGSFLELPNAWNYTEPAQLFSAVPPFGFPGDIVVVVGYNFDEATPRVIVGQTEAFEVMVLNDTAIQFRAGVYQNRDLPYMDLPIQIAYETGETIVDSDVTFTYNETSENVTSIRPRAGSEGSLVTITGLNFPNMSEIVMVSLADVEVDDVISVQPTEILVEAGMPLSSNVRGPLVIELTNGRVFGLTGDIWEYYPVISQANVSPNTGQNGTVVTIDISPIPNLPAVVRVNLTSIPATIVGVMDGILTVMAGESNSISPSGVITIELADNIEVAISSAWSYQAPVRMSQLTPSSGYFNTMVTITGTGFQANSVTVTSVFLAGFETTIVSQSNTQLVVRITQLNSTTSDVIGPVVIVANSGATYSSIRQMNFTYIAVQLSSVNPLGGTGGTEVTLTGVGLLAGGRSITSAMIAGTSANVMSSSSTMVVFIAGASATSSPPGNITYTVDTGAIVNFPNRWSYTEPGEITSISPTSGTRGTIVSISGSNLLGGGSSVMEVRLNNQVTTDILESFDNFVQVVAAGTTGALRPGSVQIVSNTRAITESSSSVQFEYLEPGTIMSISPSRGQDGTMVTIMGQNLHIGGVARVMLAGVEASVMSMTTSSITVEAGRAVTSGSFSGPVTIMSISGATVVSAQNFTYITEGIIFTVSPDQGRNGSVVRIAGENILGGGRSLQSVTLAGSAARILNQTSSEIYVEAPLGPNNRVTGDIVLVSDTNARVRRVDGWTYVQQGVVTSIVPSQGQYGTLVTIRGQSLLSGGSGISSLQFDDISLDIQAATNTTVIARVRQPENETSFVTESITLTSDVGGTLYLNYNWTFLNQSFITDLDPPSGFGGDVVTINGTNLLGGGTTIQSVVVVGIPGTVVQSLNDEVVIRTGINSNGEERMGSLVLESDTGALTMAEWSYDAECTNNTFGTAGNCMPCDEQCSGCDGPTDLNCTMCTNFAIFLGENSSSLRCVQECPGLSTLDNVCVDACDLNQYEQIDTLQNITFCYDCSPLCDPNLGCSGPLASQCNGCLFVRDALNQTCIEECPMDTFFVNSTKDCIPCHPQCSGGCIGPSDAECRDCANFRIDANTLTTDVSILPNTVCREMCPNLFFLDASNDYCVPCDPSCSMGCTGPTPFDCTNCSTTFIISNDRKMCTPSCNTSSTMQQYYLEITGECRLCHSSCLPGGGCSGPEPSDCNVCSLSQDSECVNECTDSTYFIRTTTRECVKCHSSCGTGGCREEGPGNCIRVSPLSAGGGTIAIVIIVILILVAVIVVLIVILLWGLRDKRFKYKFPSQLTHRSGEVAEDSKRTAELKSIPLKSIEEPKDTANPAFMAEYSEMGPEDPGLDVLYSDAEGNTALPEKGAPLSASQADIYTDMDGDQNLAQSPPEVEEVSASQDLLYTDMEPILPEKGAQPLPDLPPKPADMGSKEEKPVPALPPKEDEPSNSGEKPPLPAKADKPVPPGPPPVDSNPTTLDEYIDMQGGIKEVFINAGAADDVYDDVQPPTSIDDSTYEDTDAALESMQDYRRMMGTGNSAKSTSNIVPREPPGRSLKNRQSAPALPSQPIPKKRSSGTPLPQTPLQKSLSSTSTVSSPTSPPTSMTFSSRPQSIISGGGIPEEESLYDDIGVVQPLVKATPAKPQPQKKQKKKKMI